MLAGLISRFGIIAFFVVFFRQQMAVEISVADGMPMNEVSILPIAAPISSDHLQGKRRDNRAEVKHISAVTADRACDDLQPVSRTRSLELEAMNTHT